MAAEIQIRLIGGSWLHCPASSKIEVKPAPLVIDGSFPAAKREQKPWGQVLHSGPQLSWL
jgi:hypothetical protein